MAIFELNKVYYELLIWLKAFAARAKFSLIGGKDVEGRRFIRLIKKKKFIIAVNHDFTITVNDEYVFSDPEDVYDYLVFVTEGDGK